MIFLSKQESDSTYGSLPIRINSKMIETKQQSRVSRDKTLDGGSIISHSGVSDGDLTIDIEWRISESEYDLFKYLYENETFLNISTRQGFFEGVIDNYTQLGGLLSFSFLVQEAL